MRRTLMTAAGALTASLVLAPTTLANVQVNTAADTPDADPGDGICADADGLCSLRAAIQEANATGGSCVIVLDGAATYTLSRAGADEDAAATGDLDVSGDIIIKGAGATVDAAGLDRAFDVQAGAALQVIDLHVVGGAVTDASGGGYRSAGELLVLESTVSGSAATGAGASGGAIFNDGGTLTVVLSTLSGNAATRAGGAIEANGGVTQLLLADLVDNQTGAAPGNGGGFHLTGAGDVTVDTCLVTGNTAASEGGGLWNSGTGTMLVTGSTITGNVAGGDDATNGGGGVFNDGGTLTIVDTVIASNLADGVSGSGGGVFSVGGTVEITDSSLEANEAVRAGGGIEVIDGVVTLTNVDLTANDVSVAGGVLNDPADANPGNGGALHVSGMVGTVVTVDGGTVTGNLAESEGGGLWNQSGSTLAVQNGTLIAGNAARGDAADNGGGGIFNNGGLVTVSGATISDNVADGASGSGGGILNDGGTLEVTDTQITGNASSRAGGGIEANAGSTTVTDSSLNDNATGAAPGNGGGLHLTGTGDVTVESTTVMGNTAAAEGGGLWNSPGGTMLIVDCRIGFNVASGDAADQGGGGVFNEAGVMTIEDSIIRNNSADGASGSGGGILNNGGTLDVFKTRVAFNDSNRAGGGIEANVGSTSLDRVNLFMNSTGRTPGNGGGLHLTGAGMVEITESWVMLNTASNEGGGLWNSATGSMIVDDTMIAGNAAPIGPDAFNDGGKFTIDGVPVPDGSP